MHLQLYYILNTGITWLVMLKQLRELIIYSDERHENEHKFTYKQL